MASRVILADQGLEIGGVPLAAGIEMLGRVGPMDFLWRTWWRAPRCSTQREEQSLIQAQILPWATLTASRSGGLSRDGTWVCRASEMMRAERDFAPQRLNRLPSHPN